VTKIAFTPLRKIQEWETNTYLGGNSDTIAVGDAVIPGATTHAGAVIHAYGTTGIVTGVATAILAAPGNSKPLEVTSYAFASNNETVAQILVRVVPTFLPIIYNADGSANFGTTTSSKLQGTFNLSNGTAGVLDETSYGVFSTQKQFASFGVNPLNVKQVIGKWSSTLTQ
jgi:hypothetical protein